MARLRSLLPIGIFLALIATFAWRLVLVQRGVAPNLVPSALIDKPLPAFDLPAVLADKPGLKSADLQGKVTLINFFSSWCIPCRAEQPMLVQMMKGPLAGRLTLVGIDYKDGAEQGRAWLGQMGDPFSAVAADADGRVAIDFGVYGVPESYLIDRAGRIRFKETGPFTADDIQEKLLPLVAELSK